MENIKPKSKPLTPPSKRRSKKVPTLSKEQVMLALQKKKECNAIAQRIVEELLDPVPEENIPDFLAKLVHINQSHYNDIIEERSITKLCGYPVCAITLTDIPEQQYRISVKVNKVYDITDRKKYCSSYCYKSSEYLKVQLLTSPLWARKEDELSTKFKLLPLDTRYNDGT